MFVRAVPGADDGVSKVMSRSGMCGMCGRSGVSARASSAADRYRDEWCPLLASARGTNMKLAATVGYDNAKRYLSSAFLSSLVGLSLTLTLGRLPPSLSRVCCGTRPDLR